MSVTRSYFGRQSEPAAPTAAHGVPAHLSLVRRAAEILKGTTDDELDWISSELEELMVGSMARNVGDSPSVLSSEKELAASSARLSSLAALVEKARINGHRGMLWEELLLPDEFVAPCFAVIALALAGALEVRNGSKFDSALRFGADLAAVGQETARELEQTAEHAIEYAERHAVSRRRKQRKLAQ